MSISAKPWDGGGASSVPDASETTKGKIKIATTSESNTGTDDLTAMTPAKVKARIDAALVGGVEYKGTWNATTGAPTLINAVKGDLYKVDTAGTIYGKVWAVGDQLIINDDMGGSITNSKIDKIDNTEAVTSVNGLTGAVLLSMDNIHDVVSGSSSSGDLLMYDGSDWNNTAKSSIAVSAFNDDNTYLTVSDNLSDLNSASTARTNLGLGTASTSASSDFLAVSNNLSDLNSASTARTNLGLGTASTKDTGVANGNVIVADATGLPVIDGSQLTGITATDATKLAIANNLSDLNNAGTARTNLGLGTASTSASSDFLAVSNNLSDLNSASTARTNLGLVIGTNVLGDVVDDTSPQLGGDLDLNSNKLTSASNGNVELTPHGTGHIKLGGNTNPAEVRFFDEAGTNYIALKAPADADLGGDYTLTLPVDDGTANQVLKTDGSGVLSWTTQTTGGYTYSAKTTSFTAAADYHYSCTNAITATLPAASSNANKPIRIKVMGTDTVTIGRNGSDKIDGVASDYSMTIQYSSITLFSNGSDGWEIV